MLRFDEAIIFSPLLKSNLSMGLNIRMCDSENLLFSEFINIVSIFNLDAILLSTAPLNAISLYWLNYVIVYVFSDFVWLIQRVNNLFDFL